MPGLLEVADERAALAHALVQASGSVIRPYFRAALEVEAKGDASPVTLADREAELAMRALIEARFPEDGIVGEEYGETRADAPWVWVLDPIDGTVSFVLGLPIFGTLVALCRRSADTGALEPALGLIHQPITEDLLIGDGARSLLNGSPVRARACADLAEARLLTSCDRLCAGHFGEARWRAFARTPRIYRGAGDCMAYFAVATGFADLAIDAPMRPWDYLALMPVLAGAGATIVAEDGGRPREGAALLAGTAPLVRLARGALGLLG